jgi:hypothetical protein
LCFYPTINCPINATRGVLPSIYIFKNKTLWDDYIKFYKPKTYLAM